MYIMLALTILIVLFFATLASFIITVFSLIVYMQPWKIKDSYMMLLSLW